MFYIFQQVSPRILFQFLPELQKAPTERSSLSESASPLPPPNGHHRGWPVSRDSVIPNVETQETTQSGVVPVGVAAGNTDTCQTTGNTLLPGKYV